MLFVAFVCLFAVCDLLCGGVCFVVSVVCECVFACVEYVCVVCSSCVV